MRWVLVAVYTEDEEVIGEYRTKRDASAARSWFARYYTIPLIIRKQ